MDNCFLQGTCKSIVSTTRSRVESKQC